MDKHRHSNDYFDDNINDIDRNITYNNEERPNSHLSSRRSQSGKPECQRKKPRMPIVLVIAIDVIIAALGLLFFSLFYFILPRDLGQNAEVLPSSVTSVPAASASQNTNATASQNPNATANPQAKQTPWGQKFSDKFTDGKVERTAISYKSANVNVTINKVQKSPNTSDAVTYYVADIYVSDLKYFKTAFAGNKFAIGNSAHTYEIAKANDAVIAINGDNCIANDGPVVRNGILYRSTSYKDVCVMNNDGSMQTFTANEFDMNKIKSQGAYQVWTFGPMLLNNGETMAKFNSTVNIDNPRTAIGYFEPGHYCFVVVDGRQPNYSKGLTLQEMSQLFHDLGCKVAFNLDGGQSAEMALNGELVNQPYDNGRPIGDILYITDK